MQALIRLFTDHPAQTGETFSEHLWFTFKMASKLLICGFVLIIHGLCPFLCTRTASKRIEAIYGIMKSRIPKEHGRFGDGI